MTIRLAIVGLFFVLFSSTPYAKLSGTARWIPEDAYVVASIHLGKLLQKSAYLDTREWQPILRRIEKLLPETAEILNDPNATGLNLKTPARVFLRGGHEEDDPITLGIILVAADKEKVSANLEAIAKKANLREEKAKGLKIYLAAGKNIGVAIKGQVLALIGIAPMGNKTIDPLTQVAQTARALLDSPREKLPETLEKHLGKPADLTLYVDGTSFADLARKFWPNDRWKTLLPVFRKLLETKFEVRLTSQSGRLILEIENPEAQPMEKGEETLRTPDHLLDSLPGDLPLVAGLSFDSEVFRSTLRETLGHFLKMLPGDKEKLTIDTAIPGFDASANELLDAPSGHFLFGLGAFRRNLPTPAAGATPGLPTPSMILGAGISSQFALGQLLAGANAGNTLDTLLAFNGLNMSRRKGSLWISTTEHRREVNLGRPLRRLSKKRRELLAKHPIAADLDLQNLTRSLREAGPLPFGTLKGLDLVEEARRIVLTGDSSKAKSIVQLHEKDTQAWHIVGRHLAQEIIDRYNDELFRAIARNNPQEVIKAVNAGALVNAPDRFGHSPMHYAAYKGNSSIVEYLLDRGGDPNARGRHDSTPLHSAAWGRNRRTLEVLLENGADVNARTDEGETPSMTASLRGEKETLEILLALSADPHAKDVHGTGLAEIAAAGGHKPIVDLLRQIGVKVDHPFHVAAGLGDLKGVKEFLGKGKDVNARDGFGATPLLIATVAGQEEMVDFLLQQKADPSLDAKDGYSLMHGAAFSGKKTLIRKALSLGMEINARYGPDGITPVDVANEDTDAASYLRTHGGRTGWELGRP